MSVHIDKLIRSKRATISIEINENGELIVRAPLKCPLREIEAFVLEKREWIDTNRAKQLKKVSSKKAREYIDGETFLFLGKDYPLRFSGPAARRLSFTGEEFVITGAAKQEARELFMKWYRHNAKKIITHRTEFYSQVTGLRYNGLRIKDTKTRWGSCSFRNNLNFHWKLILAPLPVLDYVVIHELCHTEVKDHSRNFWNKVASIMPHYKTYRQWLKENGHILEL